MKVLLALIVIISCLGWSCEEEKVEIMDVQFPERGIYILNSGYELQANASLSFLNLGTGLMYRNLFEDVNMGSLGEMASDMAGIDSIAYILVTNSSRIIVFNTNNQQYEQIITDATHPKHMIVCSKEKAYISDIGTKQLLVMNPMEKAIIKQIPINSSANKLLQVGIYVYATSYSNNSIYRINTTSDEFMDSLSLPIKPIDMLMDKSNKVWVLCDEETLNNNQKARLIVINPNDFSIEKTIEFDSLSMSPSHLAFNNTKDTLFITNSKKSGTGNFPGGIYKMSVYSNTIPANPFIPENNYHFGFIKLDPLNNDIFICNYGEGNQDGGILRYSKFGKEIYKGTTGINPVSIYIKE